MTTDSQRIEQFSDNLRQCHRRLFNYLFALVRDIDDAQDVFQETSMVLWRKYEEFRPGSNFAAWALAVAQLKASEFLRGKRRYRARFSDEFAQLIAATEAMSSPDDGDVWRELLDGCIEKLPTHQRHLLRQCYDGKHTVAEVAASLGRPVRSLYNSLRSIREKLLHCVENARPGEPQR
jgi:RNA polymerase sigma-70 factor, ECF subfamily